MSKAPENVWILGNARFRPWRGLPAQAVYEEVPPWADDEPNIHAYIRADLVAAKDAEIERLREALESVILLHDMPHSVLQTARAALQEPKS